jgi:hypothetical protein
MENGVSMVRRAMRGYLVHRYGLGLITVFGKQVWQRMRIVRVCANVLCSEIVNDG